MMRLPWQRSLPSNHALYIQHLWESGGRTREPVLLKFGIQHRIRTTMTVTASNINCFFKFKMADVCHVGKYSKCHNSLANGPTMTQHGWSHPIMFSTCPPCCGCHGNGCAARWTFCSYGRLETEHVNLFRWKLVHNSTLRPQWQPRDQILQFLKFKMADGRHVSKHSKCHNSPTNGPTVTQLGLSHPIMFSRCPPWCGCHGNGRCLTTAHCTFGSYGRHEAERMNQFCWNLVYNSKLGPQSRSQDQIIIFLNSKWLTAATLENIRNAITRLPMDRLESGMQPAWSHPIMFSTYQNGGGPPSWKITLLPMDRLERNLRGRIPSCSGRVRRVAVAMATAVRRIEHFAVMGVWRPNTWNYFDESWYTTVL